MMKLSDFPIQTKVSSDVVNKKSFCMNCIHDVHHADFLTLNISCSSLLLVILKPHNIFNEMGVSTSLCSVHLCTNESR